MALVGFSLVVLVGVNVALFTLTIDQAFLVCTLFDFILFPDVRPIGVRRDFEGLEPVLEDD